MSECVQAVHDSLRANAPQRSGPGFRADTRRMLSFALAIAFQWGLCLHCWLSGRDFVMLIYSCRDIVVIDEDTGDGQLYGVKKNLNDEVEQQTEGCRLDRCARAYVTRTNFWYRLKTSRQMLTFLAAAPC